MSSFEFNKIIASIIIAVLIIIIIDKVGDFVINTNSDKLKETAYKIDIPETSTASLESSTSTSDLIEPITYLLASASIENGERIYKKCGACHNYQKDSKSKIGPNLWEIINRPKGNIEGFSYSDALITSGGIWTYEELNNFLYNPKKYIVGTKMNFAGLKKAEDRANLILWLRKNSDNPASLP